ncbi:uncharacterized protein [Drosophila virilis]|uniref:uncharacterized protein n=1 Tax=Drosophila virilis TaxID=7244 RepID=UPI001395FDA3|nr:uncharacterized protein LOC116650083 [Drosophila virilis]
MTGHHVPSQLNRADILSRGIMHNAQLWHNGPPFLQAAYPFKLPEQRQKVLVLSTKTDLSASCKCNNTFAKLQRTFAYVYRFIALERSDSTRSKGPLTPDDIKCGTHLLIKNIQLTHFAEGRFQQEANFVHCAHCWTLRNSCASAGAFRTQTWNMKQGIRYCCLNAAQSPQDLSTSSFIAALKRFISLRGKPHTKWTDNSTNFVGARNEVKELRDLFISDPQRNDCSQLPSSGN